MFAVIYRWRLHPGHEESFTTGWELVTAAIRNTCGSYGSRLHRADDGTWVAYALWPDAESRKRCRHGEHEGERLMAEAVSENLPQITMTVASDLLA
ncbi:MAG TPA: hypothetical protein VGN47_00690 [Blastococcus sp.]|nr:hypothetical protein [Blastococcus sp.]